MTAYGGRAWQTRPGQEASNSAPDPKGLKLACGYQRAQAALKAMSILTSVPCTSTLVQ